MTNTGYAANAMNMQNPAHLYVRPRMDRAVREAIMRRRRRKAMMNTLLEGLATIGLSASFVLCAVMVLCAV